MNNISIKQIPLILTITLCMPLQCKTPTRQPATKIAILFSQFINACAGIMKRETQKPDYFYTGLCKKIGVHQIPLQKIPTTKRAERIGPKITCIDRYITFMKFNNPAPAFKQLTVHPFRR